MLFREWQGEASPCHLDDHASLPKDAQRAVGRAQMPTLFVRANTILVFAQHLNQFVKADLEQYLILRVWPLESANALTPDASVGFHPLPERKITIV